MILTIKPFFRQGFSPNNSTPCSRKPLSSQPLSFISSHAHLQHHWRHSRKNASPLKYCMYGLHTHSLAKVSSPRLKRYFNIRQLTIRRMGTACLPLAEYKGANSFSKYDQSIWFDSGTNSWLMSMKLDNWGRNSSGFIRDGDFPIIRTWIFCKVFECKVT